MDDSIIRIELEDEGGLTASTRQAKCYYIKYQIEDNRADVEGRSVHWRIMETVTSMSIVPAWGGITEGWIVQSRLTAAQIRDELRQYITGYSFLLVIEIASLAYKGFEVDGKDLATWYKREGIKEFMLAE